MVGQTVGKYRVVSRLGRGGMGTVYKAVDETLEREVAIKCLNHDVSDADVLRRFRAEAITLARLNHPSIATLFELTEHDGELLMVMEFVRGETFESLSHTAGPLPVDRAAQLCSQVLDALAYAHRANIVHRDLKPANLMLTESGLTKVMDFGLARMAGSEHLTNNGFMVGTPAYMAPEQVMGGEIDGRADLYAMGVVLFRLLTTQLPFKADSGIAMVQKQLHDPPTPVRQLRTELPIECDEIIGRALAKAPHDRFQTAQDFRAALVALGAPLSGIAASASVPAPLPTFRTLSADDMTMPATPSPAVLKRTAPKPDEPSAATVVIPPASAPASAPVPARPRPNIAAIAVIAGVLLAGAAAAVVWRGRTARAADAPEVTAAAPASAPSVPAAPPPVSDPAAPANDTVAKVDPTAALPSPAGATPKKKDTPAAKTDPTVAKEAPAEAAAARAALPVVTFDKMKVLVIDGGKSSDHDISLRLGADTLDVLENGKSLESVAYQDVIGVYLSHSREPRWMTPQGATVPVAKASGKFGFLRGTPDWITVRTRNTFIPLQIPDEDLRRVIAELESRIGSKIVQTR